MMTAYSFSMFVIVYGCTARMIAAASSSMSVGIFTTGGASGTDASAAGVRAEGVGAVGVLAGVGPSARGRARRSSYPVSRDRTPLTRFRIDTVHKLPHRRMLRAGCVDRHGQSVGEFVLRQDSDPATCMRPSGR
ncbi:hypothetical protein GCM10009617_27370 [Leifsonia poae]|uniref:Secreted protein n=1 Tax=Leifsonia poae TaxID=110933 RepID=A0A9W6HBL2_9MICO|nr:hypothetical protein GCM10017584_26470 [Leifsonia poae]